MRPSLKRCQTALITVLALALPSLGHAQNDERSFDLGTIILGGELIERDLQESPTSAYVETGSDLEERGDVSVLDTLSRAGNVTTTGGVTIRGIQQGGSGRRTITTVVDGVRVSDDVDFGPLSTWDLEQVEVLRGPQSTQTGRNALAGTINIKSRDPIFEDEYRARLRFGSLDGTTDINSALAVNQVLVEDRLALRFSYEGRRDEGLVRSNNPALVDFSENRERTARASLRWDPNDRLSVILKYTFAEQANNVDGDRLDPTIFRTIGERISLAPALRPFELRDNRWNLRVSYDINNALRLESETTYWDRFVEFLPTGVPTVSITRPNQAIEQEVKLVYDTDRTKAVGGLFYTDTTLDQFTTAAGPLSVVTPFQRTSENFALFGEVDYEVIPRLRLIAGARYDTETTKVTAQRVLFFSTAPGLAAPPSLPGTVTDATYEAFLPKLGVVYEFNDNVSLGFVAQQAYRAGGAGVAQFTNTVFQFDPEFTDNYELSLRSNFFDQRLFANANVFFTDWRDQQVQIPLAGNPLDLILANAGASELFGAEFELRALPTDGLEIYSSVGYAQTEYRNFVFNGVQLAGNEFPGASDWTASLGARYTFLNGIWLAADATYQGPSFVDIQNTARNSDQILVDLRLGYTYENWSAVFYVDNVFNDETEQAFISNFVLPGVPISVTDPREIGFILQAEF